MTRASLSEKTCFAIMSATHDYKILLGTLSKERAVSARRAHYPAPKQTARLGSGDAKDDL